MSQSVRFDQIVKIVNEFSEIGEKKGLGKLYTEDNCLDGRIITIKGKPMLNLGSCSYLGLELDRRLKEAAIEAIEQYGTLFASSRIYVSTGNYSALEALTSEIYGRPILLTTTVSIGHNCVMPIIISANDMVIFDQQAHISMQEMMYKLTYNGSAVNILRHNRLDELESKIEQYREKYDRIWYVIDGVYSMFGDLAPVKEIVNLLNKHKKLWLYADDAHGMSWSGPHGAGHIMSQTTFHPRMVIGTTMAKGFGSCGGAFVFNDTEMRDKVKRWGGPLAYSGPQEPATVAAALASAKIHLSDEIYTLQSRLQEKICWCNDIFTEYKIPLVSVSTSPIFFVACGLPRVGFNLVERLMNEGFYTNIGIFPAVPETCTGVRFTLTNHITKEDISRLAEAFARNHPLALRDEGRSMNDIYKAFRKFTDFEKRFGPTDASKTLPVTVAVKKLNVNMYRSVSGIGKTVWNELLGDRGAFDYDNLLLLEKTFIGHKVPENNWNFFYFLISDSTGEPILCTYLTSALSKDDMLAPEKVSEKVETLRRENPYYLTSRTLMTGSLLTNGDHLYLNRQHPDWKEAAIRFLDAAWQLQDEEKANTLLLRDFNADDTELSEFFIHQGFVKIDNLENNVLNTKNIKDFDDYFSNHLTSRQRKVIKKEVLSDIDFFETSIKKPNKKELKEIYTLYENVKVKNLALNTFKIPFSFFEAVNNSAFWEIMTIIYDDKIAGALLSEKTPNCYTPVLVGLDYSLIESKNLYKKILYFIIRRSFELKARYLYLGITANESKRKFGVQQLKQVAFVQVKDHYNQDVIDNMAFNV